MSFGGRLETLDLSALLQTLSVGAASGRLTLTRLDKHAVLVLRSGRVVYVSGGSAGETLAGRLLREKLVGESDLMTALERQHDGSGFRRLGDVLVEAGVLAEGTLQAVVRLRMEELIGELMAWRSGFFRFEPAGSADVVEVDLGDFVLPAGLPPQELLMRAVTALDQGDLSRLPPPEPPVPETSGPTPVLSPTGTYPVDFTGEAVLGLLRFASQMMSRGVVFAVEGESARGVGEFGVQLPGGRSGAEVIRHTSLSLREPSILRAAVERRRTYAGPLEPTRVNLGLLEALGGAEVKEAVAVPLVVGGEVRFVLYADNATSGRPIGPLDTLESSAARAARIIEKTLLARARGGPDRPA
ncbi:MAG TPA: DUF4388 domain-containing protein [Vicinamibacteria bacterium]|nr:DUF4388 domain-containing protein [Vicinamibacteria bacterium]